MDIQDMTAQVRQFCDERDWGQFHNPKDLALALSIEASELVEHFLWKNGDEVAERAKERREELSHEIADVAIYLLELCSVLGLDLGAAIQQKLQINARRYPVERARGNSRKYTEMGQS